MVLLVFQFLSKMIITTNCTKLKGKYAFQTCTVRGATLISSSNSPDTQGMRKRFGLRQTFGAFRQTFD